MNNKLDLILEKLGTLTTEIAAIKESMATKEQLNEIESELSVTKEMVAAIAEDIGSLKSKIRDVETTTAFVTKDLYMLKKCVK